MRTQNNCKENSKFKGWMRIRSFKNVLNYVFYRIIKGKNLKFDTPSISRHKHVRNNIFFKTSKFKKVQERNSPKNSIFWYWRVLEIWNSVCQILTRYKSVLISGGGPGEESPPPSGGLEILLCIWHKWDDSSWSCNLVTEIPCIWWLRSMTCTEGFSRASTPINIFLDQVNSTICLLRTEVRLLNYHHCFARGVFAVLMAQRRWLPLIMSPGNGHSLYFGGGRVWLGQKGSPVLLILSLYFLTKWIILSACWEHRKTKVRLFNSHECFARSVFALLIAQMKLLLLVVSSSYGDSLYLAAEEYDLDRRIFQC